MKKVKRNLVIAGLAVATFAGAGAAIAANRPTPKEEQKAVIDDAAKQLGVAPDKLTSALQQALVNRVEAAVKDGRLTREQADAAIARIKAGDLPLGGPGFGRRDGGPGGDRGGFGRHGGGFGFGETGAAAAAYLGVTEAQLQTAREAGKSLATVAKEKGKTTDGLKAAMLAAATKAADAAVTAGKLTKEQRDKVVANAPAWLDHEIAETHTGRGHGGGFGGPDGAAPGGAPATPAAPPTGTGTGTGTNDGSAPVDLSPEDAFQTA
jgi:hypothetical protein